MKKSWFTALFIGIIIGSLNLVHYLISTLVKEVQMPLGFFPGGFPFAFIKFITGQGLSGIMKAILVLGFGIIIGSLVSSIMSKELTFEHFRKSRLKKEKVFQAGIGGI